ncbi:MAG: YfcE family phosphodiesterase [Patescibacteria group bacterium]|jgi:hypothetical protein
MLVAIISDVHDNLPNLKKCLGWCEKNKIDRLICCGDLANAETLFYLAENFKKPIYLVSGNADSYSEKETKKFKNINYFGEIGEFKLEGKNIGICHWPYLIDKLLENKDCEIIFYGHTHKPWLAEKDEIKKINPGEMSGMWSISTFAVWDTENNNLELKLLEKL